MGGVGGGAREQQRAGRRARARITVPKPFHLSGGGKKGVHESTSFRKMKAELEADPRGKVAASSDEPGPMEKAFAMFVAFSLFGSMPLLGFIAAASLSRLSPAFAASEVSNFFLSVIITAGTLFALGTVKSQFGAGVWWRSGLEVSAVRTTDFSHVNY